jgi:hypothetical protein
VRDHGFPDHWDILKKKPLQVINAIGRGLKFSGAGWGNWGILPPEWGFCMFNDSLCILSSDNIQTKDYRTAAYTESD